MAEEPPISLDEWLNLPPDSHDPLTSEGYGWLQSDPSGIKPDDTEQAAGLICSEMILGAVQRTEIDPDLFQVDLSATGSAMPSFVAPDPGSGPSAAAKPDDSSQHSVDLETMESLLSGTDAAWWQPPPNDPTDQIELSAAPEAHLQHFNRQSQLLFPPPIHHSPHSIAPAIGQQRSSPSRITVNPTRPTIGTSGSYAKLPGGPGSPTSTTSDRSRPLGSSDDLSQPSRSATSSIVGVPHGMCLEFYVNGPPEAHRKRPMTEIEMDRMSKMRKQGSCYLCYLSKKPCTASRPCERCTKKAHRCVSHYLVDKNIFWLALPASEQEKLSLLARDVPHRNLDGIIARHCKRTINLNEATEELALLKLGSHKGCASFWPATPPPASSLFGAFYQASVVVQGRSALLQSDNGDEFGPHIAAAVAIRALEGSRALQFLDNVLEKNVFMKEVRTSPRWMRNLIAYLAMVLEQTLSFECDVSGDIPGAVAAGSDNTATSAAPVESTEQSQPPSLAEMKKSLVCHLAYALRETVDKTSDGLRGLKSEIHIDKDDVSLTDKFWRILNEHFQEAATEPSAPAVPVQETPPIFVRAPTLPARDVTKPTFDDDDDARSIVSFRSSHSFDLSEADIAQLNIGIDHEPEAAVQSNDQGSTFIGKFTSTLKGVVGSLRK